MSELVQSARFRKQGIHCHIYVPTSQPGFNVTTYIIAGWYYLYHCTLQSYTNSMCYNNKYKPDARILHVLPRLCHNKFNNELNNNGCSTAILPKFKYYVHATLSLKETIAKTNIYLVRSKVTLNSQDYFMNSFDYVGRARL